MSARILIIEDDASSLELVRYLLHAAGYQTLVAADGDAGLRRALDDDPDLILCDLQMPVLDGYEVVRRLREHRTSRRRPMLAISAFSMPGDRDRAIAAGFDGYLPKPIVPETFVEEVEAFLPPHLVVAHPDSS